MTEEECEQQRADVRAIHVGVGHQNDLPVSYFRCVEIFLRNSRSERRNHGANFFVRQHLVVARFFNVENFAFQRQDGLKAAIAPLLGSATCGLALNQEQFAAVRLPFAAIR